jgi:NAD(P)-dependent dehydrogenase (short-subunit alcohol dehydrogenase family)
MTELFAGKVALVTGAGDGIGRESARIFAREGARVVVADISTEQSEETVRLIRDAGGEASFVPCDVSVSADVEAMVAHAVTTYGRLDAAHNNAGMTTQQVLAADVSEEDFDRLIDVNLKGVWLSMKYEIPAMLKSGGGAIVNAGSSASVIGLPKYVSYTASKHGVAGLTRSAALDYAKLGVRVNCVCPGPTRTRMMLSAIEENPERGEIINRSVPLGRMVEPEEVAELAVFLCSSRASGVVGVVVSADGGITAQ